jgi:hypothetical protein
MRKLIAVGAVCATALGVVGAAQAGVEARDANGNFIVFDADFSPPATGKAVKVTGLNMNVSFGNKRNGQPFPQTERLAISLPKGSKYNGTKFPKCPLNDQGQPACNKEAQVGKGGAIIDARALCIQEPVVATVVAYNGPLRDGNPTLLLDASATVNGQPLQAAIDFVWTQGRFELIPPTGSRIPYSFASFDLDLGAYFKSKVTGRKATTTSLIQPPKTCPSRGWAFSLLHQDPAQTTIVAPDRQPCVKVK